MIVRHVWIAPPLKIGCRPRLPIGGGRQVISGSNQTESDPPRLSAVARTNGVTRPLYADQFAVLHFLAAQLLVTLSNQAVNPAADLGNKAIQRWKTLVSNGPNIGGKVRVCCNANGNTARKVRQISKACFE